MFIFTYAYMYTYIHTICVYLYTYTYIYTYIHMYTCIKYTYIDIYIHMYICVCIWFLCVCTVSFLICTYALPSSPIYARSPFSCCQCDQAIGEYLFLMFRFPFLPYLYLIFFLTHICSLFFGCWRSIHPAYIFVSELTPSFIPPLFFLVGHRFGFE